MNYRLLFSGRDCVPTETKKHVNFDKKRILRHRFNSGHLHQIYANVPRQANWPPKPIVQSSILWAYAILKLH